MGLISTLIICLGLSACARLRVAAFRRITVSEACIFRKMRSRAVDERWVCVEATERFLCVKALRDQYRNSRHPVGT